MAPTSPSSLVAFVRELTLARQKLSLYQEGHPSRKDAVGRAHAELRGLVARTGALAVGISPTSLLGPEEKLDSPAAGKLAAALHRRGVAMVRFDEGVEPGELEALLERLSTRPAESEAALWTELEERGVRHIHLEPIDLVEVADGLAAEAGAPATLWDGILESLLGSRLGAVAGEATQRSAEEVLRVIQSLLERYQRTAAGDRDGEVPEATLAEIAEVLRKSVASFLRTPVPDGPGDPRAVEVARLLRALPPEQRQPILETALRELCAPEAVRVGLTELAAAVPPGEILACLRRLRGKGTELAPEALLELEEPMAAGLEALLDDALPTAAGSPGEGAEDDVDRLHPHGAEARIVLRLHRSAAGETGPELAKRLEALSPHRRTMQATSDLHELLQRSLFDAAQTEAIARRLVALLRELLADGRVASTLRLARSLHELAAARRGTPAVQRGVERCLAGLAERETLAALVEGLGEVTSTSTRASLEELLALLGEDAVRHLVLALGEEEDRSRRRKIFDLLSSLGPGVAPHAIALLEDSRWYVVRNMLSLLLPMSGGLSPAVVEKGLRHPDARVRLEGVRCLGALGASAPAALIRQAVEDPDPKVAEAAVTAVGARGLRAGLGPLLRLLRPGEARGDRALRVRCLQALGQLGDPAALPEIRRFFGGWLKGVSAEERRAAFASLAHYPEEARRPFVESGLRSRDAEVRAICAGIVPGAAGEAPGRQPPPVLQEMPAVPQEAPPVPQETPAVLQETPRTTQTTPPHPQSPPASEDTPPVPPAPPPGPEEAP